MEEIEVNTIEIDEKKYIVLDEIKNENNTYYYLFELTEAKTIQVLKEQIENNEKEYVSVDNENEFDKALTLFYLKHKSDYPEETAK